MKFANIIIDISHEKVDRPFQYGIPEPLQQTIEVGMCVLVPFGQGNTVRRGYVIELIDTPEYDPDRIKQLIGPASGDAAVESKLIKLAWWIKQHYGSTMITALKTVLPARHKTKQLQKKEITRLITPQQAAQLEAQCRQKHQVAKARILHELITEESLPADLLRDKLNISAATLNSLEKQGAIRVETVAFYRNPVRDCTLTGTGKTLSSAQQQIVDQVLSDADSQVHRTYLIHGITGSGKTEVYLELIAGCIARGRQAIVLIPEIALTYQTVMRFYRRFGDRVSVMNSTLSPGEKYDQCERAKNGDIDVIIGPRSALFTPFPHIGLIVIDEEHEPSYKSETMPKYHARDVAIYLAGLHGASVVLGSATPSMESYYHAKQGDYGLFTLRERLTGNVLPQVYVADMRTELREGNRSVFSRQLQNLMEDRLRKGEQTMLFLNRRGYAGFISCRNCGLVLKCPHCDVSLSEHRGGRLVCHYCGYEQPAVKICPKCGSRYIMGFKAGTEQVEEKLHALYPSARILRMDADTTKTKDSYEKILSAFADRQADILLGTQMIVKGHDFPHVTLVGALAADMSLFANDYRAGERTFQLLTQAAGRAGRGEVPGEVVIQTYQPEHYSIRHAVTQDYEAFYEEELLYREMASYPPAAHMLAVLVMSRSETGAAELAQKLADLVRGILPEAGKTAETVTVIGPSEAAISRLSDVFRRVFYLKSPSYEALIRAKDRMEAYQQSLQNASEQIQFDFNPMNCY